jgi:hypothetical protein
MPYANAPEPDVVAFLLVAALERYQSSWDRLIESWSDRGRWRQVNRDLEEVQKLRGALPQLAADMMEVVMRHAQLLRSLLRCSNRVPAAPAEVNALRRHHQAAIESMRGKCLRLFSKNA